MTSAANLGIDTFSRDDCSRDLRESRGKPAKVEMTEADVAETTTLCWRNHSSASAARFVHTLLYGGNGDGLSAIVRASDPKIWFVGK